MKKYKYDLGIIGGMGSEASVELYRRIIDNTKHNCDQEHMKICVLNNSIIPDRTTYILNGGESPLPYLNEAIKDLENLGAKYFVIGCNTAHYFSEKLEYKKIGFINMIDETIKFIKEKYPDKKVCVLSTKGTASTKVYYENKYSQNIEFIYLSDEEQEIVMDVITMTKNDSNRQECLLKLSSVVRKIENLHQGCLFVMACTELSLYKKFLEDDFNIVDAMDCLVSEVIKKSGYNRK